MNKRNLVLISLVTLWGTAMGCSTVNANLASELPTEVTILHSETHDGLDLAHCPAGASCAEIDVADLECGTHRANVVVLAGETTPPQILGESPAALADKIACLQPELIVFDISYGFSAPILYELALRDVDAMVVGAQGYLADGLTFQDGFFAGDVSPEVRASYISAPAELTHWHVDRAEIEGSIAEFEGREHATTIQDAKTRTASSTLLVAADR